MGDSILTEGINKYLTVCKVPNILGTRNFSIMTTSEKIIDYISINNQASGKQLYDYLGDITLRAVRKQLKNLLDKGLVKKIGKPPRVYYSLKMAKEIQSFDNVENKIRQIIDDRYLFISPSGESRAGWEGFLTWCEKTKQDPIKTANDYVAAIKKFDKYRKSGFIDGMAKMEKYVQGSVFR